MVPINLFQSEHPARWITATVHIPDTHVCQRVTCILGWDVGEFGFEVSDPFWLDRWQLRSFKSLREQNRDGVFVAWVYLAEVEGVGWLRHPDFRLWTFEEFGVEWSSDSYLR